MSRKEHSESRPFNTFKKNTELPGSWGRYNNANDPSNAIFATIMLIFTPLFVLFVWNALYYYDGELGSTLESWLLNRDIKFPNMDHIKDWSHVIGIYVGWILFQAILFTIMPGEIGYGQTTPGGHLLPYKLNGWNAYWLTVITFSICSIPSFGLNLFSPTIIYDNWTGLLILANVFAYSLTLFAYIKAKLWPSHPNDVKWSGSLLYDIFMGAELNPRFGSMWDFKLFFNGRPGIIGWTLINLSMAAAQYQRHGFVSIGMILVNIFQAIYVIDFFYFENWYLRTIDIAHDHFGFYFAWGDNVWLPMTYTLQAQFLVLHPDSLSYLSTFGILALFSIGYWIFRSANSQKDYFRSKRGDCKIWGYKPEFIRATYTSSDGNQHESLLLLSGFWGISRHFNYLGDLLLSLATCLACGTISYLLPFFYIIYMTIILVQRVSRDSQKCKEKYGKYWNEYCQKVPWKIIPFIY